MPGPIWAILHEHVTRCFSKRVLRRYIPFTGGDLEQDISNLFNHLVNIFNRIYQALLTGSFYFIGVLVMLSS